MKCDLTIEYVSGVTFYVSDVIMRFNADHTILIIDDLENNYYIPMEYVKNVMLEVCK